VHQDRPRVLIEDWLPIAQLSAECKRERGASSALPPLYFLHVWWARKPLTAARAGILGSILPDWRDDWPAQLRQRFPTQSIYRAWVTKLLGIVGDSAAARRLLEWAAREGRKIPNPYEGPRAFTVSPDDDSIRVLQELVELAWGPREVIIADPMAGGGSIPFEAARYGFRVLANEMNPVASVLLRATLDYPARFGPSLADDIRKWGARWHELVQPRLAPFYSPLPAGADGAAYLWARTVACPTTGKPVPLSPSWWLQRPKNAPADRLVAARLLCEPGWPECRFEIVSGKAAASARPSEGTVKRGVARSPWTGESVDGDYIKAEAQAGRMGLQLYAVAVKREGGFDFRPPEEEDAARVERAAAALAERMSDWAAKGLAPTEPLSSVSNYDRGHRLYGMHTWDSLFSARQLFALCTFAEVLEELQCHYRAELPEDVADALSVYLSLAFDKAADYNSLRNRWDPTRTKIPSGFEQHNYALKWSVGEFDASRNLLPWVVEQVSDAYRGISELAEPARRGLFARRDQSVVDRLSVSRENAASLPGVPSESVTAIVVDPPYLDNVMYAELSDFFYVWMKRNLRDVFPDWFTDELVNKEDEAVANYARFAFAKARRRRLAHDDYERKMAACFREMFRILSPDGVLTVMFTHKQLEAWDTLTSALIEAGFAIKASWPIHTESEHSLHQAKKNAAASTILLVCRKRTNGGESAWWDDLKGRVRETARTKAREFEDQGIRGVDLYISTFGPVLSVISERWPVLTSEGDEKTNEPKPLRPETALDLAREEIIALRKQGLLLGRSVDFDPITDWYLMAWDAFRAQEFPADEARKLALALGLDLDSDIIRGKRIVTRKQNFVAIQPPGARRRRGSVDPEQTEFDCLLDAVHTAMLAYQEDGAKACEVFLDRSGLRGDSTFRACLQAMINAVPRTKEKGEFIRVEAALLEAFRLNFFDDLEVPPEEVPPKIEQLPLEGVSADSAEEDESDDEGATEEDEE